MIGNLITDTLSGTPRQPRLQQHRLPTGYRYAVLVLTAAVTVAVVRALLVQSFVVPTGSMEPTVHAGDRVLVSRVGHLGGRIHRGDVVVIGGNGVFGPATAPAGDSLAAAGRAVSAGVGRPGGSPGGRWP